MWYQGVGRYQAVRYQQGILESPFHVFLGEVPTYGTRGWVGTRAVRYVG